MRLAKTEILSSGNLLK